MATHMDCASWGATHVRAVERATMPPHARTLTRNTPTHIACAMCMSVFYAGGGPAPTAEAGEVAELSGRCRQAAQHDRDPLIVFL